MNPHRLALAALTAALLSACAQPVTAPPVASGPLTQQDVTKTAQNLSDQLMAVLQRAAKDEGVVALQAFPQNGVMINPFFGYGVSAMQNRHPEQHNPVLGAFAVNDLPRGDYLYNGQWLRTGDSDDLSLSWPYGGAKSATATFNWDASSPTIRADASGQSLEVPTGLNMSLTADGQSAADVNVETTYYAGCGKTVLEPASLTVNGAGSLLKLENVGYSVLESDAGDSVTTQGKTTLVDNGLTLEWNVAVNGNLTRKDCFSESFTPVDGAVSLTLAGLSGDTQSLALDFGFTGPSLENGSLVVNGDDSRAVTFSGTLSDSNGNGVPGDGVTVRFPDGSSTTLEQLIESLGTVRTFRNLRQP